MQFNDHILQHIDDDENRHCSDILDRAETVPHLKREIDTEIEDATPIRQTSAAPDCIEIEPFSRFRVDDLIQLQIKAYK